MLDGISGINDIDYLCGAKYRGQLQGMYRHGVGALIYAEMPDKPLIGYWKEDLLVVDGVTHPNKKLEAISVVEYEGRKKKNVS